MPWQRVSTKPEKLLLANIFGHDLFPARPLVLKDGRQLPDNYSFLADGARATTLGSTAHRRDTGGLPKLWTKTRVEYF